jgi:hypothetical protein
MKEIKIRIGKDGKINLSVAGVKGGACKDITKALEKALGMVESTKATPEMYEQQQTQQNEQSQGSGGEF